MPLTPGVEKRFEPVRFFRSQASVFAGMGIQSGNDQMGARLKRWQKARSTESLCSTRSGLRTCGTWLRGMWVVASRVFSRQPVWGEMAVNSIDVLGEPASSPSRSVWPG